MLRARAAHTFEAFRNGRFRLHWTLTVMAFMSFSVNITVMPILAYSIEETNRSVALAVAGNGIAWFFIGPFAGVLTDRIEKRRLIALAQTAIALNFAVIAFLILQGWIQVLHLTISSMLLGSCFAFTGPARRAYVADLVPPRLVGNGVALLQGALNFPQAVGPVVASLLLLLPFVGFLGAYVFMAAMLSLTILCLSLMPPGHPRDVPRGSVLRELLLGLRYGWSQPRLRVLISSLLLVSALAGPYQLLLPGLLENVFDIRAEILGLTTWPLGVASFLIGLSVAGVVGTRWSRWTLLATSCAFGIGVALLGVAPTPLLLLPVFFLLGAGFSGFLTLNTAEVIRQSSPEYHGRMTALTFLPFGVQSFTGLGFGYLADAVGEQSVFLGMGLAAVAVSLVLGLVYLRLTAAQPAAAVSALRQSLGPLSRSRPQK